MPQLTPSALRKQIAAGATDPLYMLVGDDETEKAAVAAEFAEMVDEGLRAFNVDRLFGADMDVAQADANYSSVVVPFALGNTYEHTFSGTEEWTFDRYFPLLVEGAVALAGAGLAAAWLRAPRASAAPAPSAEGSFAD